MIRVSPYQPDATVLVLGTRYPLDYTGDGEQIDWQWASSVPVCPGCDGDVPPVVDDEPSGDRYVVCDCGERFPCEVV